MKVITATILFLLISLLMLPMMVSAAVQPIPLFLNGKKLSPDVAPRIINASTVVPIRIIAESLGARVQWEEKSRKVTVDKADMSIQLFIDKRDVTVNNKPFTLETAPAIIDGSTMLPLRFVGEQLGVEVTWDEITRSVFLFQAESDAKMTAAVAAAPNTGKAAETSGTDSKTDVRNSITDKVSDKPVSADAKVPIKPSSLAVTVQSAESNAASPAVKPGDNGAAAQAVPQQAQPPGQKPAEALTTIQSIAVEGDQLLIKTSGAKAIPNVTFASEPNRIFIDIPTGQLDPALKLNANGEGNIKPNNQAVSQIRYLLFSKESSIVRIIVDLTKKIDLKPAADTAANQLAWTLILPKDRYRVVIDPGHGGKDTGAVSLTKRLEKDLVLSLGIKVQKLLEKEPKIEALITRKDDTFVELADRAAFANDRQADLYVSVHGNSTGKESIRGVETYYYSEQSLTFAKIMHQQLLKATGFPDRKVKQSGFHVIKNTKMPSLLIEVGFLSNEIEENAIYQDAFQNQVAASIVAAVKQQLNID